DSREIGSLFIITATAKPGDDLTQVRKSVNEEVARLLQSGLTQDELDRVRTQFFARFVRGAERIGGFGGKSDILAQSQVFGGSPDSYKKTLNWIANATPADLQRAGGDWLQDGLDELDVRPFPKLAPPATGADP